MEIIRKNENGGTFIYYYVKDENTFDRSEGNAQFFALTNAASEYEVKYLRIPVDHLRLGFYGPYFTDEGKPFLPGSVWVAPEHLDAYLNRAAEWYIAEYRAYRIAQDAVMAIEA